MKITKEGLFNRPLSKKGINLIKCDKKTQDRRTLLIGIPLIALLTFVIAKFGVIDQYTKLSEAQSQYNAAHAQLAQTENILNGYEDVLLEYRRYSKGWMGMDPSDGTVSVERTDILSLIEDEMMTCGTVNNIEVMENQVTVLMSGMNLTEISNMCAEIQKAEFVESSSVSVASTIAESDDSDTTATTDYDLYILDGNIVEYDADVTENPDESLTDSPSNNSDILDFAVQIMLKSAVEEA